MLHMQCAASYAMTADQLSRRMVTMICQLCVGSGELCASNLPKLCAYC